MIKVPGSDKPYNGYQSPLLDDSFDPTRDDWSRHEEGGSGTLGDGLGFHDEDAPTWFEFDDDDSVDLGLESPHAK